jgi:hypothetical protein
LAAWTTRKIPLTCSFPFVAVAGDTSIPVLGLQNEYAVGSQNDVVYISAALPQIEVI